MAGWISVKDRLPKAYKHVLTYDGDIREGYLTKQGHWMGKWNGASDTVTHWMPLPEPPKEEREMTPEERLLMEIFAKSEQDEMDEMPDNYPVTHLDKADYAMHCMHKSLKSISPALGRISRLCGLLRVSEKDGKNTLPDIITHNESRMALKHITLVKQDVDDAYQEILSIFESTKEPGTVSKTESVEQGPGGEGVE